MDQSSLRAPGAVDIYREGAFPNRMPTISEAGSEEGSGTTRSHRSESLKGTRDGHRTTRDKNGKGKGKEKATTPTPSSHRSQHRHSYRSEPTTVTQTSHRSYHEPPANPSIEPLDRGTYAGGQRRSMDDVREQVARNLAITTINNAEEVSGHVVGVCVTLHKSKDLQFLRRVASWIDQILSGGDQPREFVFIVCTSAQGQPAPPQRSLFNHVATLEDASAPGDASARDLLNPPIDRISGAIIAGSSPTIVQKAGYLLTAKFIGRSELLFTDGARLWLGRLFQLGESMHDEDALWDVVRKSAQFLHGHPATRPDGRPDPVLPPPGSKSINEVLSNARAKLERIPPDTAYAELTDPSFPVPVVLVDIRPEAQRRREGEISGAAVIERNVLEWRFDPRSEARLPVADRYDLRVIVVCQEGFTSSLAAASLQELGLYQATDIIGGIKAWREAGLPLQRNQSEWEDETPEDADGGVERPQHVDDDPALNVNDGSSRSSGVTGVYGMDSTPTPSEFERMMDAVHEAAGVRVDSDAPARSIHSEDGDI